MKTFLAILFAASSCMAQIPGLQIWTKDDLALSAQSNAWSRSEVFLTYGSWLARRDSVSNQITATIPDASGDAGTYRVFLKAFTRQFEDQDNPGVAEFRLGTNAWANINFGQAGSTPQSIVGTNYVAATSFTNAQVRFNWIATGTVQDFYFEAFGISSNTNVAFPAISDPEPAKSLAYIDAGYDYGVPPVETDVRPGNMLRNASFELGWQPGWMYARNSQVDSNTFKPTFLKSNVATTNNAFNGTTLAWINDGKARFAVYNSPIRLRPGTRQYTLSFYMKALSSSLTAKMTSLAFTNRYVSASSTNIGYSWNWTAPGTTNWVRFSTNFWAADKPTAEWQLTLESGTLTSLYLDAVQLEEGPTATTWAPKNGVEFVFTTPRNGNIFFDDEPITMDLVTYNYGGASSNFTWSYIAYGQTNHQFGVPIFSGEFNGSVAPGLATNTITIPPWIPYGHYRIVSRSSSHPEIDETMFSKVWSSDTTNGIVQIHSQTAADAVATNKTLGFAYTRTLSPGGYARWSNIEATDNTFTWDPTDWKVGAHAGQSIWLSMWTNLEIPAYAVSGNTVFTNMLWDYINRLAGRYTNKIAIYEMRNEPSSKLTAAELRDLVITEENALHTAYPEALYVSCGGMADTNIAHGFLSILPTNTLAGIYGLSCHLYPVGGNVVMNMNQDDADRTRYQQWRQLGINYNKPIFNSESGVYGNGPLRTYNLGIQTGAAWTYESLRHEPLDRSGYNETMRAIAIVARSLGHGFAGVYYYDARYSSYIRGGYIDTNPTVWDFYDEARPQLAAILQFKRLVDPPTFAASVTNVAKTDAYVFGKNGQTVAILWTQDKTNRSVTLASTNFGVRDIYGNPLQTNEAVIQIGRVAKYIVSSLISTSSMVSLLSTSIVATASDTVAPALTMDWFPPGSVNENGLNNVVIKWTALDDTVMNTPLYRSNVLSRYRLGPSAAWGNWSEATWASITNLSNGLYRVDIQAKDKYNNTSELSGVTFATTNGVVVYPEGRATSARAESFIVR
jgi:hypothetical protein